MSMTLSELVSEQILIEAGSPEFETAAEYERYVALELNRMTKAELLDCISDALRHAASRFAVNPLL